MMLSYTYRVSRNIVPTFVLLTSWPPKHIEIPSWTFFNSLFYIDFKTIQFVMIWWNFDLRYCQNTKRKATTKPCALHYGCCNACFVACTKYIVHTLVEFHEWHGWQLFGFRTHDDQPHLVHPMSHSSVYCALHLASSLSPTAHITQEVPVTEEQPQ